MLSLDMILNSHGIGKQNSLNSELTKHLSDKNNPHNITKEQIGLGNVDNVKQASKTEFDAHLADTLKHRNIYIVTQPPSPTDGQDGDLFFVYEE